MNESITSGTVARTIVLALALANQVLAICGKGAIEIADNDIYQIVTMVCTVGTSIMAWWKNNSITSAAIKSDIIMQAMKRNGKAI